MYKAKEFCEAMAKVADSYEDSVALDKQYAPKRIKHNGQKTLQFEDGSYIIISTKTGVLELPIKFA